MSVHDDGREQHRPVRRSRWASRGTPRTTRSSTTSSRRRRPVRSGPLLYTENNEKPVIVDAGEDDHGHGLRLVHAADRDASPSLLAWWIHPAPAGHVAVPSDGALPEPIPGYEAHGTEVNGYTTSPIFTAPDQGDYTATARRSGEQDRHAAARRHRRARRCAVRASRSTVARWSIRDRQRATPPANDAFSHSIALNGTSGTITGTTARRDRRSR